MFENLLEVLPTSRTGLMMDIKITTLYAALLLSSHSQADNFIGLASTPPLDSKSVETSTTLYSEASINTGEHIYLITVPEGEYFCCLRVNPSPPKNNNHNYIFSNPIEFNPKTGGISDSKDTYQLKPTDRLTGTPVGLALAFTGSSKPKITNHNGFITIKTGRNAYTAELCLSPNGDLIKIRELKKEEHYWYFPRNIGVDVATCPPA